MEMMEVVLLALGVAVLIGSFLVPNRKNNNQKDGGEVSRAMIRDMVDKEVENAKSQITDIVDETITYAMEKTERSMERLTNEKMMAVNEYSDTVLGEINKNHKEVVFLYDMLNDKHENLKSTVSQVEKTASEVKQTVKDAEITVREVEERTKEVKEELLTEQRMVSKPEIQNESIPVTDFVPIAPEKVEVVETEEGLMIAPSIEEPKTEKKKRATRTKKKEASGDASVDAGNKQISATDVPEVTLALNAVGKDGGRNSNERILELHKAGKSNMAIAKELGLGIGEVKLVIDLFEGM